MKKDNIRDYATEAFRFYVRKGRPTYEDMRAEVIRKAEQEAKDELTGASGNIAKPTEYAVFKKEQALQCYEAELNDILAVNRVLTVLSVNDTGKRIRQALEAVYFAHPYRELGRGEISSLALKASQDLHYCEMTIYRYLAEARKLFAIERGLRLTN